MLARAPAQAWRVGAADTVPMGTVWGVLEAALDVVRRCPCADGCPGCVGPAGNAKPGTKAVTRQLLEAIVEKREPCEGSKPSQG